MHTNPLLGFPKLHFSLNFMHFTDWSMKDVSLSCERPKLENFLGVGPHSFGGDHQENDKMNTYHLTGNDNTYNMYQESSHEATSATANSTIGLSMIKNWLRNNPAPPHAAETNEAAPPPTQTLSLSMSTGSQSTSPLPTDTKLVEASPGAVEAVVPRKSIDTFGQRTSIYRGVTRLIFRQKLLTYFYLFVMVYFMVKNDDWGF